MAVSPTLTHVWFLDTLVTIHVSHTQGADTISLLEHQAPAGHSPPLHIHRTEDELFHVLTGDFEFHVGDQTRLLTAGASLLTPKGIAHTFRVRSTNGGKWLTMTTHTDFERFVRAIGRRPARGIAPTAWTAHSGDGSSVNRGGGSPQH